MSDLLTQLSSFLNLSKLVAVTVPGIIATCALLIFFNPPACTMDPQNCWYCQGQQAQPADGDQAASASKAKNAPTRATGSFLASRLTWEQTDPYRLVRSVAQTNLRSCAAVPEYIVANSRLKTATKETVTNLGDLEAIDPRALLDTLDHCSAALSLAQAELNRRDSAESAIISTKSTTLTTLRTGLTTAQNNSNVDLARSLQPKVDAAQKDFDAESQKNQDLQSAVTAAKALSSQISTFQTTITGDVSTAIPVTPAPTPAPWQTAAAAIGGNIMMFTVVCIIVGQLLDPIQRSFIAADPIRGLTFPFLNLLYRADQPMGMVRFGDQSYQTTRRADVDDLLAKEPHLLDPNYAIGKGLLTQADYSSLQDQYFSQSQITTGLMLPAALLAIVIYLRLLACKDIELGWGALGWALLCLTLFLLVLAGFVWFFLWKGEDQYARSLGEIRNDKKWPDVDLRGGKLQPQEIDLEDAKKRIHEDRELRERRQAEEKALSRFYFQQDRARLQGLAADGKRASADVQSEEQQLKKRYDIEGPLRKLEQETARERQRDQDRESIREFRWRLLLTENEKTTRFWSLIVFIAGPVGVVVLLSGLIVLIHRLLNNGTNGDYNSGNWWVAGLAVGLPALEVLCFIGGIDRLHNFYSVVQARIVGSAKKQEESQITKFANVLTDVSAKKDFFAGLKEQRDKIDAVLRLQEGGNK